MSTNKDRKEVFHTNRMGITTVSFQYPEHYSQQQTGFTPAGGAKNHFPGCLTKRLTKVHSITHNSVLIAEANRKALSR